MQSERARLFPRDLRASERPLLDELTAPSLAHQIYWTGTPGSSHPIAEWWSRIVGVLFLSFLSGPFAFGADIWVHLKQTMVAMVGLLICFVYIVTLYPEQCAFMWYPQIALQVAIVLYNAKLLAGAPKGKSA